MLIKDMVFDKSIFPRGGVNFVHIGDLCNAALAGAVFPPIIIDRATNRIVDGAHRYNAYLKLYGENYDALVDLRDYADENELWIDAVEANASHGLGYSAYDRTLILVEADKRGIKRDRIATMIRLTTDKLEKKFESRTGFIKTSSGQERVALRTSLRPLHGKLLTKKQQEVNGRSGLKAEYAAQILLDLLSIGITKWGSASVKLKLKRLNEELTATL